VRIAIGADHAGFALKTRLMSSLRGWGHDVIDLGTHDDHPVDYPAICADVARAVAARRVDRGIIIGGSGQGEQIAANKIAGIRAALCNELYTARMSRAHNDANVLTLGGRIVAAELADEIVKLWLETAFDGGRHQRRIEQITALEARGAAPGSSGHD
jgi:ribose 5-phosphate isomerase B